MVVVREPLAEETLAWLLGGDVAVQFQTYRDLLGDERPELQRRITSEGDAGVILAAHAEPGWGRGFYEPKWTCPHYSLLELRDLAVARDHPVCVSEVAAAIQRHKGDDGGFNPADSVKESDVCMNGMFLAFGCYFGADPTGLESVVDFVLGQRLDDGGLNCRANRSGARASSVHSTISVIDGLAEYLRDGYAYRAAEVREAIGAATGALLARHLYQRRSSGEPIRAEFTRLHHPARWHFDVLRGLDVFRGAGTAYDDRLDAAVACSSAASVPMLAGPRCPISRPGSTRVSARGRAEQVDHPARASRVGLGRVMTAEPSPGRWQRDANTRH